MNNVGKIALGVSAGALIAAVVGPVRLAILGVVVAGVTYLWQRFVSPLS